MPPGAGLWPGSSTPNSLVHLSTSYLTFLPADTLATNRESSRNSLKQTRGGQAPCSLPAAHILFLTVIRTSVSVPKAGEGESHKLGSGETLTRTRQPARPPAPKGSNQGDSGCSLPLPRRSKEMGGKPQRRSGPGRQPQGRRDGAPPGWPCQAQRPRQRTCGYRAEAARGSRWKD